MPWLRSLLSVSWLVLAVGCVIDLDPEEDPELRDSDGVVEGDGHTSLDRRTIPPFTRVVHRGSIRVDIAVDPTLEHNSIVITCDRNLMRFIDTLTFSDQLQIETTALLAPKELCRLEIEMPELVQLEHRGDGVLYARGDIRELERIEVSQFGDTAVRDLELDSLEVEASDGAGLRLSGGVEDLRIESSSRRDVQARDLAAERVEIVSSDTGLISVRASERVSGELRGDGDVEVFGDPSELDLTQSGSGEVLFR